MMLSLKVPPGHQGVWGCLECGMGFDGCGAILCDACLEVFQAKGISSLRWITADNAREVRLPIEELSAEPFEHDLWRHDDVPKTLAGMWDRWGGDWTDSADRCASCGARYEVRIAELDTSANRLFGWVEVRC